MIHRIAIRNFRSLRNVELDLGPLTVLIGPNGSGKSSVLDALRLIDAFAWKGRNLNQEVDARGGWTEVVWGGRSDSRLRVGVDFEQESDLGVSFCANIQRLGQLGVVADPESLVVNEARVIAREGNRVALSSGVLANPPDGAYSVAHLGITKMLVRKIPKLRLPDWSFHNLVPGETRGPKPITRDYRLDVDGSNLATVVHTLFSDGHPALDDALDFLRGCVPTVERLVSPIFGEGQTYVALAERGVPHPVGSWGLSDGTLLALAIGVALVTPKPPDLICLESPEAGIHPRMLEAIADLLKSASAETQVIVTTHSPYLLRWLPHEDFVVVEKADGATTVRPLRGDVDTRELVEELGAGDAWYAGYLGGVP